MIYYSVINGHKKQVSCCTWNQNGNWLASGSMDGLIKLYDIRTMKEIEVWRGHNSEVCTIAWHPIHETLMVSGGYNGSLIYWLAGQTQTPHSVIADAHRASVDVMAWHPAGHLLATASHDSILKFWCREPPGCKLEPHANELTQENPPIYSHGPIPVGTPSIIAPKQYPTSTMQNITNNITQTSSNIISNTNQSSYQKSNNISYQQNSSTSFNSSSTINHSNNYINTSNTRNTTNTRSNFQPPPYGTVNTWNNNTTNTTSNYQQQRKRFREN